MSDHRGALATRALSEDTGVLTTWPVVWQASMRFKDRAHVSHHTAINTMVVNALGMPLPTQAHAHSGCAYKPTQGLQSCRGTIQKALGGSPATLTPCEGGPTSALAAPAVSRNQAPQFVRAAARALRAKAADDQLSSLLVTPLMPVGAGAQGCR